MCSCPEVSCSDNQNQICGKRPQKANATPGRSDNYALECRLRMKTRQRLHWQHRNKCPGAAKNEDMPLVWPSNNKQINITLKNNFLETKIK